MRTSARTCGCASLSRCRGLRLLPDTGRDERPERPGNPLRRLVRRHGEHTGEARDHAASSGSAAAPSDHEHDPGIIPLAIDRQLDPANARRRGREEGFQDLDHLPGREGRARAGLARLPAAGLRRPDGVRRRQRASGARRNTELHAFSVVRSRLRDTRSAAPASRRSSGYGSRSMRSGRAETPPAARHRGPQTPCSSAHRTCGTRR